MLDAKAFDWLSRQNGTHTRVQAFLVGQVPLDGRRLALGDSTQRPSFPAGYKLYAPARATPWQLIGSTSRKGKSKTASRTQKLPWAVARHRQRPEDSENDAASMELSHLSHRAWGRRGTLRQALLPVFGRRP